MCRRLAVAAMLVLALAGCGKRAPTDKVTYVADDDPRMNAAMDKARSSVNTFIAALRSPKPGQSGFSVKAPFSDGANTEHMWLTQVTYDGASFRGTVDNEPDQVKTVRIGQTAAVAASKISDWMYVENGKLVGGETLRVLRSALSPGERADFDKSIPFVID